MRINSDFKNTLSKGKGFHFGAEGLTINLIAERQLLWQFICCYFFQVFNSMKKLVLFSLLLLTCFAFGQAKLDDKAFKVKLFSVTNKEMQSSGKAMSLYEIHAHLPDSLKSKPEFKDVVMFENGKMIASFLSYSVETGETSPGCVYDVSFSTTNKVSFNASCRIEASKFRSSKPGPYKKTKRDNTKAEDVEEPDIRVATVTGLVEGDSITGTLTWTGEGKDVHYAFIGKEISKEELKRIKTLE
jgi:hypothetical protein